MTDDFEDHCWKDVIPASDLAVYATYNRETYIGAPAALVAVDLYEQVYRGGPKPVLDLIAEHPLSCGEHAFAAIPPTQRLFAAARAAGGPAARLPLLAGRGPRLRRHSRALSAARGG